MHIVSKRMLETFADVYKDTEFGKMCAKEVKPIGKYIKGEYSEKEIEDIFKIDYQNELETNKAY